MLVALSPRHMVMILRELLQDSSRPGPGLDHACSPREMGKPPSTRWSSRLSTPNSCRRHAAMHRYPPGHELAEAADLRGPCHKALWSLGQPELSRTCLKLHCSTNTFLPEDAIRMGDLYPSKSCQYRPCLRALVHRACFCAHHWEATARSGTLTALMDAITQRCATFSKPNVAAVHLAAAARDSRRSNFRSPNTRQQPADTATQAPQNRTKRPWPLGLHSEIQPSVPWTAWEPGKEQQLAGHYVCAQQTRGRPQRHHNQPMLPPATLMREILFTFVVLIAAATLTTIALRPAYPPPRVGVNGLRALLARCR